MKARLRKLREILTENECGGIFINSPVNRRYITGFTGSAGAALITKDKAMFITDFRYIEQAKNQCPDFEMVEQKQSIFHTAAELTDDFQVKTLAFEKDHVTFAVYELLKSRMSCELKATSSLVEDIRLYKDKDELSVLQKAAVIADEAFDHITNYIKPGMREIDVSNELEFFMRKKGAASSSFDIIVASGKRSAFPHGVASDKKIESGELVTLDFGAYYQGYCSDITRTLAVGEPSAELKKIYQTVYEAQMKALEEIKPGMSGADADAVARDYIKKQGYGEAFGHGLGHGLGMEVHENPRLSPKGDTLLRPGMIVTVEPGIYVPGTGGTRIEDDIVITENGNSRLTLSEKELMIIGDS
ncbi:aminopeptidase P family protein [Alteribacillus sp. HJP-4]|uniref:aminopeptidase P family protein n=1 Tax=Alteribacillus sp. HJP-4 TaxID=2775394 RepID=UPI0035CD2FB8